MEMNPLDSIDSLTALGMLMRLALAAAAYLFLLDLPALKGTSSIGCKSVYLVCDFDLSLTTWAGLPLELLALLRTGVGLCVLGGDGGDDWRFDRFAKAPGDGVMERRFTLWRYDGDWSGGRRRLPCWAL